MIQRAKISLCELSLQRKHNSANIPPLCIATKRVFIHQDIYAPFLAAMVGFTAHLKPGDPSDPNTGLGPVQNLMQYERVKGFVDDCRENGYKFATGEQKVQDGKGYFIQPTVRQFSCHSCVAYWVAAIS